MITRVDYPQIKSLLATSIKEPIGSEWLGTLFEKYGTTQELIEVTVDELLAIKGIGPKKANQILAAIRLLSAYPIATTSDFQIKSPDDAYLYLMDMTMKNHEEFVVIGLNTKNKVVYRETIFVGTLNSAIVHPREVFKSLLRRSCASAIVAHNHPSGDPSPSHEDKLITERLAEAGRIVGIEIVDHIIVSHSSFVSMKAKGYF